MSKPIKPNLTQTHTIRTALRPPVNIVGGVIYLIKDKNT